MSVLIFDTRSLYFLYRTSEPNSPSLARVRIFIFGRTAAIVRMIFPRSVIVMLQPRRNVMARPSLQNALYVPRKTFSLRLPKVMDNSAERSAESPSVPLHIGHLKTLPVRHPN